MNGIAISVASVFKGLGPALGGSLYAWTLSSGRPYPLDVHGAWNLMAAVYLLLAVFSWTIPVSIARPKEGPTGAAR